MITVIIVEDESLVLKALKQDIDYDSIGMQVVGCASDGETALQLIQEYKPDVLISDIVVPKRSGLDLLRCAKELRPDTHGILISGHLRFDYAQQAIEYGVDAFLSKPLFHEQLYDILKNISLKIQEHNRQQFEADFFTHELKDNLPLLREIFVRSLIEGPSPADMEKRLAYYDIHLADAPLTAICILPEEKNDITMLSLRRCVTSFMEITNPNYCFASHSPTYNAVLCVLFQCDSADSPLTICEFAEHLRIAVQTDCGFSCTIGTGSIGQGWTDISSCVTHAMQALTYRFYIGINQVIAFQDINPSEHTGTPHLIRQLFPSILTALNERNEAVLEQLCDSLYREAAACSLPPKHLQLLFTELLSRIISDRYDSAPDSQNKNDVSSLYEKMLSTETLEDMVNLIRQELNTTQKSVNNYIAGREEWLVKKIKEIIKNQYTENLTIDAIAGQVYISSGYAMRIFRKHTGESINSYIVQTRMTAAADILKNPSISIGEAAARTGYANVAYFSSVFRKKYNYTPREWRDMHAMSQTENT